MNRHFFSDDAHADEFLPTRVQEAPIGQFTTPHARLSVLDDGRLLVDLGEYARTFDVDRWELVEHGDYRAKNPRFALISVPAIDLRPVHMCVYCKQEKPGRFRRTSVGSRFRNSTSFCCDDCDRRFSWTTTADGVVAAGRQ